jgi:hypothetical protein
MPLVKQLKVCRHMREISKILGSSTTTRMRLLVVLEETTSDFNYLNMVSQFCPIAPTQSHIDLINDDGKAKEKLDLQELDPIFATSFDAMIKEAFAEGKHFLIAKITTKKEQGQDFVNHNFFYNAYSILKIIFQKKGEHFVGRFHERYPITVKNPITNTVSALFF